VRRLVELTHGIGELSAAVQDRPIQHQVGRAVRI